MTILKRLALTTLVLCVFLAPGAASAQSLGDIQKQISDLLAKVQSLQGQLASVQSAFSTSSGTSGLPPRVCLALTRGLSFGLSDASAGGEVSHLQQTLKDGGFFTGDVTGYFGMLTKAAVQRFQAENGVASSGDENTTGFGAVGPRTRMLLSGLCSGGTFSVTPQFGAAPLSVRFSMQGYPTHTAEATTTYLLDFGDGTDTTSIYCPVDVATCPLEELQHTYTAAGSYIAVLKQTTSLYRNTVRVASAFVRVTDGQVTTSSIPQVTSFTIVSAASNPHGYLNAYDASYALRNTTADSGVAITTDCHNGLAVQKLEDNGGLGAFTCGDIAPGTANGTFAYGAGEVSLVFSNTTSTDIREAITLSALNMNSVSKYVTIPAGTTSTSTDASSETLIASPNNGSAPLAVGFRASQLNAYKMYAIDFGDGSQTQSLTLVPPPCAYGNDCSNALSANTSHTYASAGTYSAHLDRVVNGTHSVRATATVHVSPPSTTPTSIRIITPVEGRTFTTGSTVPISWSSTNAPNGAAVEFEYATCNRWEPTDSPGYADCSSAVIGSTFNPTGFTSWSTAGLAAGKWWIYADLRTGTGLGSFTLSSDTTSITVK